jgi:DNA invertase Pin-like site-specific DNA recombinase
VKRAAIYARYSSDLQSPTSIADQLRLCRAYCERQGWAVVASFEDAALSGASTARPGYQRLMTAALPKPAPFDVIVVEGLDRLSRDLAETARLHQRLRLHGIDLVGVSDGIDTSRRGATAHVALKGVMNALYLEDLADKTHRGLEGRIVGGLSAGGRCLGYRTVPIPAPPGSRAKSRPARVDIDPDGARVVVRIFQEYARGQSFKAIAFALNADGVPPPGRRGWPASSVRAILLNEQYAGHVVWNRTRFVKDPDAPGRRRPIARPSEEWIRQERPELRIIEPALWDAVQARLRFVREAFGCRPGRPARGRASLAYSPALLSGLLHCAACGARLVSQTFRRRKAGREYAYGWYRCGAVATKGPTVCAHRTGYHRDVMEEAIVAKFRDAMRPAMVRFLAAQVNHALEASHRQRDDRTAGVKAEILRLEREAANLVRFVRSGGDSATVREELQATEGALAGLRAELARADGGPPSLKVDAAWVQAKLAGLEALLARDPVQAKGGDRQAPGWRAGRRPAHAPTGRAVARGDQRAGETKQPPGRSGPGGCLH